MTIRSAGAPSKDYPANPSSAYHWLIVRPSVGIGQGGVRIPPVDSYK